jgi:OOP family OmpA-OmpF porin
MIEMNKGAQLMLASLAAAMLIMGGCATAKKGEMAAPAEPAESRMEIVRTEKVFDATELFEFDSAVLSAGGMTKLDNLVSTAGDAAGTINVIGHADRIGTEEYNMGLSQRRAQAVADYLIGKGVPASSISAMGRGESDPVVQCTDTNWKALVQCLAPNRRVVVTYPVVVEEEVIIEN